MPMLPAEFTLNLSEPIKPGKVAIGYFDGVHPSIVAVTRSDKIFVHNPHNRLVVLESSTSNNVAPIVQSGFGSNNPTVNVNDLNFLNINQTITCLGAGPISATGSIPSSGTPSSSSISSAAVMAADTDADGGDIRRTESNRWKNPIGATRQRIRKNLNMTNHDILLVGTRTSIHAYDILHNTDLFYKEIPDGANTLVIGEFPEVGGDSQPQPQQQSQQGNLMALVGGVCAIHGFDRNGADSYWMVTGDNITAMALVDIDADNQNELVVGSQDCEIQVFKKDAIIAEMTETDCISHLCRLDGQMFAYALANGTVGVYRQKERLWRIKSKNQIQSLFGYDINGDGQMELVAGWSNGKLDIRVVATGEVLYRENYKTAVAGIMAADYNMDGRQELLVCTVDGDVHGYRLNDGHDQAYQRINLNIEQETIRELMKRRQTLAQELRNYEENARLQRLADPLVMNKGQMLTERGENFGAIPADTKLKSSLILQSSTGVATAVPDYIELRLETTNQTKIRAAVVFAEGIFKHESVVIYPDEPEVGNHIAVPLRPPKDVPVDLHVKALVGYRSALHYHVFELSRRLPRFAMYAFMRFVYLDEEPHVKGSSPEPEPNPEPETARPDSFVTINTNETITSITEWICSSFLFDLQMEVNEDERRFEFVSLRDQSPLIIEVRKSESAAVVGDGMERKKSSRRRNRRAEANDEPEYGQNYLTDPDPDGMFDMDIEMAANTATDVGFDNDDGDVDGNTGSGTGSGSTGKNTVTIYCDSMEVAGNCVQSLGEHLELKNVPCHRSNFPEELRKLRQLIDRVEEIQSVRQHLVVEVADSASMIRASVVQAEDARLTEEYHRMRQIYNELAMLNRDIMREYKIRCQNHQDLVDSLKQINLIIQRASNLRLGTFKTTFINACREAIKMKNFVQLLKIINEN